MSTTIERLLIVQDRDRRISKLLREQADIPERARAVENRLNAHRESLALAQEQSKKTQAATKELDVEVESRKQKILKFREQQFQIKSNTEYKALEHEIAVVEQQIRDLEDRELELMEAVERDRKLIADREKDLAQEEKRVREDQVGLKERLESMNLDVQALQADRDELAKGIDPDWLARYDRVFKKLGDLAIVPVENSACGGCHMNLQPQLIHDAKKNLNLITCSFCGRILYWSP